jgi:hypothetical protein
MVEKVQPSEGSHFMNGVRLKVGLRVLMVMRDGGVAFQAEQRWRSGQKRLERWGSKRAKGMRDGGVAD